MKDDDEGFTDFTSNIQERVLRNRRSVGYGIAKNGSLLICWAIERLLSAPEPEGKSGQHKYLLTGFLIQQVSLSRPENDSLSFENGFYFLIRQQSVFVR